jgi:hypothetical protein
VTKVLAADSATGYSLAKVADSLKNESIIFHSPVDALLHDVIKQITAPR